MFLKIAVFVVPLGFDTFAVAVLLGLRRMRPLRPAATFTFFEAVMPLVGLLIGRLVGARFETPAVVVGGIVLLGVAIYMFKEALEQEEEAEKLAFTTLRTAAFAGFGISMDELAIGFPMGTSGLPLPETIGAIAAQTFVVTFVGILVGRRLGATFGRRASTFAGSRRRSGLESLPSISSRSASCRGCRKSSAGLPSSERPPAARHDSDLGTMPVTPMPAFGRAIPSKRRFGRSASRKNPKPAIRPGGRSSACRGRSRIRSALIALGAATGKVDSGGR